VEGIGVKADKNQKRKQRQSTSEGNTKSKEMIPSGDLIAKQWQHMANHMPMKLENKGTSK